MSFAVGAPTRNTPVRSRSSMALHLGHRLPRPRRSIPPSSLEASVSRAWGRLTPPHSPGYTFPGADGVPVRRTFHGRRGARRAGGGHFVVETGAPAYDFIGDRSRTVVGSAIPSLVPAGDAG